MVSRFFIHTKRFLDYESLDVASINIKVSACYEKKQLILVYLKHELN